MKSGLKGKFYGQVITTYVDGNIWRLQGIFGQVDDDTRGHKV